MNKKPEKPTKPDPLRSAAEKRLARAPKSKPIPAEKLLHELQVHQIELEMQNDQLRQAQIAMEESRDCYVDLYEFAPVGYLTLTTTGQIKEANLTCCALLKTERKKLLHHRFSTFVAPECRERWNHLFTGVLQKNGADKCEVRIKNGDGEHFYAQLNCVCLNKESEAPVVRIALTDVTQIRQAEEAMREWQQFVDCAHWGMSIGKMNDRTIRLANPAYARMHGYTLEELHGIKADSLFAPESRPDIPQYHEILRSAGCYTFECVRQRKDGSTFPAMVDVATVEGADGEALYVASVTDITKQKESERALLESEERWAFAIEGSGDGVWDWNLQTGKMIFSERYKEMLGYAGNEAWSSLDEWKSRVNGEDMHHAMQELEAYMDGKGAVYTAEYRMQCKDGSRKWMLVRGMVVSRAADGRPLRMIGTHTDITAHKQAEQQLRDLTAHLQTVREEEKTTIAREIHDDLGGTLTALKMEAYWLAEELPAHKETVPLMEHVKQMAKLTDHATGVMRRIITGLRPTILDDLGLLAALEWQCMEFQNRTGIRCRMSYVCADGESCETEPDKDYSIALFRTLQESLTNVSRHSRATKVDVEFFRSDNEVMLSVSDNGRGLPENSISASGSYGILGMTERAEQLGGKIMFDSSSSGGLRMTVTLPLSADNGKEKRK